VSQPLGHDRLSIMSSATGRGIPRPASRPDSLFVELAGGGRRYFGLVSPLRPPPALLPYRLWTWLKGVQTRTVSTPGREGAAATLSLFPIARTCSSTTAGWADGSNPAASPTLSPRSSRDRQPAGSSPDVIRPLPRTRTSRSSARWRVWSKPRRAFRLNRAWLGGRHGPRPLRWCGASVAIHFRVAWKVWISQKLRRPCPELRIVRQAVQVVVPPTVAARGEQGISLLWRLLQFFLFPEIRQPQPCQGARGIEFRRRTSRLSCVP